MSALQTDIVSSLPRHLREFVSVQDYQRYTPQDQAVWRFVMAQLSRRLEHSAHPVYREGLRRTGITFDHIPSIEEMNEALAPLSWRAVVVDGFIPPAIFMEFQALRVLVIAVDMRSIDQIFYTPAPDILHESAGHAPFIVDVDYAEFLQRFGEVGMKAIASKHDFQLYEAVRTLSVVKACNDSTPARIEAAEQALTALTQAPVEPSEASLLTRLHWWTVEYGLVGEIEDYRLYGAGLLSSLGESVSCLDDEAVAKLPLTVDAVCWPYDITAPQPQLFVTKSCRHLGQVLEEFAHSMCFMRGGAESLRRAITAGTVCTARYDSGLQVSGVMSEVLCDAVGNAIYLRTAGPTQLAWRDREVYGHGTAHHHEGFGSPIGLLKNFSRCLSLYSIDELRAHAIEIGEWVTLEFLSGITVCGRLQEVCRQEQRNLILSFDECTVHDLAGRVLFEPSWGCYDMAVGSQVDSVYGGTADRERYRLYEPSATVTPHAAPADPQLMALYEAVAGSLGSVQGAEALVDQLSKYPDEWLLRHELRQTLSALEGDTAALRARLADDLQGIAQRVPELAALVALVQAD